MTTLPSAPRRSGAVTRSIARRCLRTGGRPHRTCARASGGTRPRVGPLRPQTDGAPPSASTGEPPRTRHLPPQRRPTGRPSPTRPTTWSRTLASSVPLSRGLPQGLRPVIYSENGLGSLLGGRGEITPPQSRHGKETLSHD